MSQFYKFFDQKVTDVVGILSQDAILLGALGNEKIAVSEQVESIHFNEPHYEIGVFFDVTVKTRFSYVRKDLATLYTRVLNPRKLSSHDLLEIERIKKELGL